MKKQKLYIVFDQIPTKKSGGLVATYISLVELLKNEYDIEIISSFNGEEADKTQFKNNKINIINNKKIDIRFYKTFKYIKKMEFKKALYSIYSAFYYFIKIPSTRKKIKNIVKNERIIVTCPSAAIFMPKKTKFILEFHIDYKYFYGKNILGRLQSLLMTKPTLSLFRTKDNAKNAPSNLNSNYIYNFFDNKKVKRNDKLIKHKILYVGRLEKQKNPIKLIEMAYELNKINSKFILDIYGTGSLESDVKQKIKELNMENKVFLKGFTTNKNIYKDYSLLWLTSDFEGFGLVIIEAKASGIPTISTNWGNAVYEVIDDKKDGYIANNTDDFVNYTNKILTDSKLQKKLSDTAYKNFNNFSKEKAKENWINFLENYR